MRFTAIGIAGLPIPMTWRIAVTVGIITRDIITRGGDIGWAADAAAAGCSTTGNCGC
jgi:hypothetical protein